MDRRVPFPSFLCLARGLDVGRGHGFIVGGLPLKLPVARVLALIASKMLAMRYRS